MAKTGEGYVKQCIKKWIKRYLPKAFSWMPVKRSEGLGGIPDFVACVPVEIEQWMVGNTYGLFVGIEAKTLAGEQSGVQEDRQQDIEDAGGIYVLVSGSINVDSTLKEALAELINDPDK